MKVLLRVLLIAAALFWTALAFAGEPPPQPPPQVQQQPVYSRRDELIMRRGANMNAAKPFLDAIEQIDAEIARMDAESKAPAKGK